MCEFCTEHKRKRWFIDPDNFDKKLLEDKKRKNILQKIVGFGIEYYTRDAAESIEWTKHPVFGKGAKYLINKVAPTQHSGQVITYEDAKELIKMADNHVCFSCACRKLSGLTEEMTCLNFGPMRDLCKAANPKEKMEEIDTKDALYRLKDWDKQGLVHEVLYAAAPFPIALCNCERKYCVPMKTRLITGVYTNYMKGHEIAFVDPLDCMGCPDYPCISKCQFGAMYVDRYDNKVVIDVNRCFGCGLCVSSCPYGAIKLEDRQTVMGARDKW